MKRAADMSDDEIEAVLDAPPARVGPYATAVRFAPARDEIVLTLDTSVTLAIPRASLSELRLVPKARLKQLELMGGGNAIALHSANVHMSVAGLVRNAIGLDRMPCVTPGRSGHKAPAA